jgi:hypothetical protein
VTSSWSLLRDVVVPAGGCVVVRVVVLGALDGLGVVEVVGADDDVGDDTAVVDFAVDVLPARFTAGACDVPGATAVPTDAAEPVRPVVDFRAVDVLGTSESEPVDSSDAGAAEAPGVDGSGGTLTVCE